MLAKFRDQHPELVSVNLVDLQGQFLATSVTTSLTGLPSSADQRDFAGILSRLRPETPMELARPLLGPATKRWILPMRYSVYGTVGSPVAFIVAAAPVEMLQSFWSQAPIVRSASIALVRDDGYLISRYPLPSDAPEASVYGKPRDGAVYRHLQEQQFPERGYVEGPNRLAGEVFGNVFARLDHFPATLVAGMPVDAMFSTWWHSARAPLLLTVLAIVGAVLLFHRLRAQEVNVSARLAAAVERLQASEAFLERIGQVAGVGGWSIDIKTNAVTWTGQTYRIHEVDANHQPTIDNGVAFYAPEARPVIAAAVEQALKAGGSWDLELPFVTARGRATWVRAFGEVEHDAGAPLRIVGAVQDVSEYRQRRLALQEEQLLRQQAERHARELEELLAERSRMLDVLAHEVRQPLHNASAALQSAHEVLNVSQAVDAVLPLRRAQSVLTQVTSSIDNTLAAASLLARDDPIGLEDTDIDTLIALVISDLSEADQAHIAIERATPTRTLVADMSLVRLALRNLLINAVRHAPRGTPVTVRVADSDDPLAIFIDVIDEGPGIDAQLAGHLFERGVRGITSSGHGLGLFIVQRVMQLHNGRALLLHNTPGQVVFRLSFNQPLTD